MKALIIAGLVAFMVMPNTKEAAEPLTPPILTSFENITIGEFKMLREPQLQEQEPAIRYDVPLDADLQEHIIAECDKHGIEPTIVFAMIKQESNFEADLIDDNGDSFGLMQVQPKWHRDRMDRLGCDDLLDPYQNVTVGIDLLAELLAKDKGLEWALMAYNGGASYANKKAAAGVVSSYAEKIITESEELKK